MKKYVYIYIYLCICIHEWIFKYTYRYTYSCININIHIHIYIFIYTYIYIFTWIQLYIYTCTRDKKYIHECICIHIYSEFWTYHDLATGALAASGCLARLRYEPLLRASPSSLGRPFAESQLDMETLKSWKAWIIGQWWENDGKMLV